MMERFPRERTIHLAEDVAARIAAQNNNGYLKFSMVD